MEILRNINDIKRHEETYLTIGTFDGLHIAHQKIIDKVVKQARKNNGRSVLLTFDNHPRNMLENGKKVFILTSLEEKIDILNKFDLDILLILEFNNEISKINASEFFMDILYKRIGIKELMLGYDHHFGKDRSGNIALLHNLKNQFNFNVDLIESISLDGVVINSTLIRKLLLDGDLEYAQKLIGRSYLLFGIVEKGDARGRLLGYPTANICPDDPNKLIPKKGVYLVKIIVKGEMHFGLMNIGSRPTFTDSQIIFLEIHILSFSQEIYNEKVKIEFIEYLREERKFNSEYDLINQLKQDEEISLKIIKNFN